VGLICIFALGAGGMIGLLHNDWESANDAVEGTSLLKQANDLIAGLKIDRDGRLISLSIPIQWRSAYRTPEAAFFTVYDPGHRPVAQSANILRPLPFVAPPTGRAISPLRLEGPYQYLTLTAAGPAGFTLIVARTAPGWLDAIHPDPIADLAPILLLPSCGVLALLLAWGIAVVSLHPLVKSSREAAAIGPETISARLSERGVPTEVRPLVQAVNAALDRVAAAYESEKRFTTDAAHALRTPLTVLDLRLQQAQGGRQLDWAAVRKDLSELARLVSGLLRLSYAERGGIGHQRRVNLGRLVRESAAAFAPRLEAENREIDVVAPDSAPISCTDAGALRDMIDVLVDNALEHGHGRITVRVAAADGAQVIQVSDEGDGVAEASREVVFQRFHKLSANSPGGGLGLAIARQTARNQGGEVAFVDRATVEVRFPG